MNRWHELFAGCVNGARMARTNARNDRRMAREWPVYATQYEQDARKAFGRAYDYLRQARDFRSETYAD